MNPDNNTKPGVADVSVSRAREAKLEAALASLPRVPLVSVKPTPLEPLPRLSELLGGPPLYVKRDDLTDIALGGDGDDILKGQGGSYDTLDGGAGQDIYFGHPSEIDEEFALLNDWIDGLG